ncbi:nucleotidyltransferase family protein [Shewanella fidelis]|uniref:nucleotidyltransferase family protein n=1 Tax=Shewanella fidelis TaxID=173509 RepID=UPI0004B819A7|nr:nucleotidyltransferase family protein [Shewanella fidelis]
MIVDFMKLQRDENGCRRLIIDWLLADNQRMQALQVAEQMLLNDWMLAAGFVRNLVWDKLHGLQTPLNDIDLIYFDLSDITVERDKAIEAELKRIAPRLPWSVKNQARMHLRNGHSQYQSSVDAMSYWPEVQTAVAVSCQSGVLADVESNAIKELNLTHKLTLHTPFSLTCLFEFAIKHNSKSAYELFEQRVKNKRWLQTYPKLRDNKNW